MTRWFLARDDVARQCGSAYPDKLVYRTTSEIAKWEGYIMLRYRVVVNEVRTSNVGTYLRGTTAESAWSIMLEGKMRPSIVNVKQGLPAVYSITKDEVATVLGYAVGVPLGGSDLINHFVFELQADPARVNHNRTLGDYIISHEHVRIVALRVYLRSAGKSHYGQGWWRP